MSISEPALRTAISSVNLPSLMKNGPRTYRESSGTGQKHNAGKVTWRPQMQIGVSMNPFWLVANPFTSTADGSVSLM